VADGTESAPDEESGFLCWEEFHFLQAKFSTGVRLSELKSIAAILARITGFPGPSRDAKRSYILTVKWFKDNWKWVLPWLPLVQLKDARNMVIDGQREAKERGTAVPFGQQANHSV
jgi:hypothetical protein